MKQFYFSKYNKSIIICYEYLTFVSLYTKIRLKNWDYCKLYVSPSNRAVSEKDKCQRQNNRLKFTHI